jgi:hypothetical protein
MNLKHRVFLISLMMDICNELQKDEKEKSARWNVLESIQNKLTRAADLYHANLFSPEDWEKAGTIYDEINERLKEMYS